MDVLDCAATLKNEANELLNRGIVSTLQTFGTVFYTGSYLLNLMAWRDIDIHLVLAPNPLSLNRFWDMGLQLAQLDGVYLCNFLNTHRHVKKDLPLGFYWGIKLETGPRTVWKIDIWATDMLSVQRNRAAMEKVANALTDDTQRLILEAKHAFMLAEGRTPMMSGFHIYEAVLFKGLRDLETIRNYLREQGITGV